MQSKIYFKMKQIILLIVSMILMQSSVFAYDFYSTSPSGHVLYYRIISGNNVYVTWQNSSTIRYTNLSGNVNIPATVYHGGITYNVIGIDNYAFENCMYLTSINMPSTVTSIGVYAFNFCNSLNSIVWGDSVQSIGDHAFSNCSGLTTINIPNSVTSIGNHSFDHCTAATTISIGNSVTTIGESAFGGCTGATSLTIGNSVTNIGIGAFDGCIGISSINIPASVSYIGASAFYDCNGISYTSYEGTINNWLNIVFDGTYSNPVYYSRSLHIGDSVVRSVSVPAGVTSIKYNTFCGMDSLLNVTLPNSIISIDHYAFFSCTGLTKIEIPSSVNSIGYRAFEGCSNIDTIVCKNNNPPMCLSDSPYHNVSVFNGIPLTTTIIVPCQSENEYGSAVGWNYFVNFESVLNTSQITVSSSNPSMGATQLTFLNDCDSVAAIATPASGFHFVQWNNGETINPYFFSIGNNPIDLIAYFDTNIFHVITEANPLEGITLGDTIVIQQDIVSVTISAEANIGYRFVQWNDGNTNNPRVVNVVSDTTFRAVFVEDINHCQVSLSANNEYWGGVSGGGNYIEGDSVCCYAQPFDGYVFLGWNNGSQENPLCFRVYSNITLVAIFMDTTHLYSVNLTVNDITMGGTTGSGQYRIGDTAVCSAIPFEGYSFRGWSNGSQENPLTFVVTSNVDLMAIFVENMGIGESESSECFTLYPNPTKKSVTIIPSATLSTMPVFLLDITGRIVKKETMVDAPITIDVSMLPAGVYYVRVGETTDKLIIR